MPQEEVALTIGFFDGLHLGHISLLNHLRNISQKKGLRSAMLTFWPHPRTILRQEYQPLLLNTLEEKRAMIEKLDIDYCLQIPFTLDFAQKSAYEFMQLLAEQIHVKHLIIGYDHRFGHNRSECFEGYCQYGADLGMEVSRAPEYDIDGLTISSSCIRRLLNMGNVSAANQCLGYNYTLTGKVVHGKQIGRTMGFPTANLEVNSDKCIPAIGVYAIRTDIMTDGCESDTYKSDIYNGVVCIGNRPTFEKDGSPTIEAHLLDFDGELYGQRLTLTFVERIRDQKRFATKQELAEAIHKDIQKARNILIKSR